MLHKDGIFILWIPHNIAEMDSITCVIYIAIQNILHIHNTYLFMWKVAPRSNINIVS